MSVRNNEKMASEFRGDKKKGQATLLSSWMKEKMSGTISQRVTAGTISPPRLSLAHRTSHRYLLKAAGARLVHLQYST